MVDPMTAAGGDLAILGSKDLLNKLLGPTADYLGGELKNLLEGFVEKSKDNVARILLKARDKLGDRLGTPGTVNPRVLKDIIIEGAFCEDELAAEYYGGILASARTESGRDDRAAAYLGVVKGLSTYEIKFHYVYYNLMRKLLAGKRKLGMWTNDLDYMALAIPYGAYVAAMDFGSEEDPKAICVDSLLGLVRHDLLDERYVVRTVEHVWRHEDRPLPDPLRLRYTPFGASLYLCVCGHRNLPPNAILDPNVSIPDSVIAIPEGAFSVKDEHGRKRE